MKKIIFFSSLFIYLLFAGRFQFNYRPTKTNYFVLLSDAFLHQQTNLRIMPFGDMRDLSLYNGKLCVYWPPLPAIILLPLVFLFGTTISDVLMLAILASLGPLLMFLLLSELKKAGLISISNKVSLLLGFFMGFGTCYFSISIVGSVWYVSQVIALLNFLLGLLALIRFYKTGNKLYFILTSFLFAGLVWSRWTLLFSLPLFIYLIFLKKKKYLIYFFLILSISFISYGIYNYQRFDSFTEMGLKYHKMNDRYQEDFLKFGAFSIRYFPHNFFYTIINPILLKPKFPYFNPNPEGNSILITSPLLLLLFTPLVKRLRLSKKIRSFSYIVCFSLISISIPVLCYLGSGWFQFGSRYLLDGIPLMIILLAIVIPYVSNKIITLLLLASISINTLGAFWLLYLRNYPLFFH